MLRKSKPILRCCVLIAALAGCKGYHLEFADPVDAGADSGAQMVDATAAPDAAVSTNMAVMSSAAGMGGAPERAGVGGASDAGGRGGVGANSGAGGVEATGIDAGMDGATSSAGDKGEATQACGNGMREGEELCDGADCPTRCTSTSACVKVELEGSAENCNAKCVTAEITECSAAALDGCCPSGCNYGSDMDCSQECGDGVLSDPETCEPGSAGHPCPTVRECEDGDPCTEDKVTGSAEQCSAECAHSPLMRTVVVCDDDDPCTEDSMVESAAACVYECAYNRSRPEPGNCADNDPCTDDTPVMSTSRCAYECPHTRSRPEPGNCADTDPCTDDTPVMSTTKCAFECPHTRRQPTAASCNDNNPCTDDTPTMSTTSCAYECPHRPVTAGTPCGSGRMCSADGECEEPPARCGDGTKQGTEECDDGRETWECDIACHRTRMYTACGSTADCRNGQGCVGGACTAVCTLGPSGFTCPSDAIPESSLGVVCSLEGEDTTQGYCRPRCRSTSDCPKGLACADNVCS
jgi:hypothetical protein